MVLPLLGRIFPPQLAQSRKFPTDVCQLDDSRSCQTGNQYEPSQTGKKRTSQVLVYTVGHTSTRNTNCDRGSHRTVGQKPDMSLTCQPVFSAESCDDSLPLPSMVWRHLGKMPRQVAKGLQRVLVIWARHPPPGLSKGIYKRHRQASSRTALEDRRRQSSVWSNTVRNKTLNG